MVVGWVLGRGHQPRRGACTTEPTWGHLEGTGGRDQAIGHLGLSVQVGCAEAVSELLALPFHKELREGTHTFPDQGLRCLLRLPAGLVPREQAEGPVLSATLEEAVRATWRDLMGSALSPMGSMLEEASASCTGIFFASFLSQTLVSFKH